MKKIFIVTLCIIEVVLVAFVCIHYTSNNNTVSEIVEEVVSVDCYNKNVDKVSLELFGVTESNRSEIFSQVKSVVGNCNEVEEIRESLNELGIQVGKIEKNLESYVLEHMITAKPDPTMRKLLNN